MSRNDPAVIDRLMTQSGRWAVVGLTGNTARPAHSVAKRIRDDLGMTIVPVNPKGEVVHGEPGFRTLAEVPGRIDVVDCFVNSRRVGAVVDQAIAAGASAVWLQLGVVDHAAADRAAAAGLDVVMDTCPLIELGARLRRGWTLDPRRSPPLAPPA
ncbi:CoA-binding protein [Kocuria sediminis]|uniref:CoA-binding protein n=1 Tax=Kocuria sediminis TaxID=1038857 RepID=A0A6N8GQS4_9MICC|nr:CoA-binding protein [Kocuria sediminis]MUN64577.1 CoA-binding protein [Kocuria sediminis]